MTTPLLPRPWQDLTPRDLGAVAAATARWTMVVGSALLVGALAWLLVLGVWWPVPATLAGFALMWGVEMLAISAARRSSRAAQGVITTHVVVVTAAAASTAATFTFAGVPLLLGLVPAAVAFVRHDGPGPSALSRAAALATAVGGIGALAAAASVVGAHLFHVAGSMSTVTNVFAALLAWTILQVALHDALRRSPALAPRVLALDTTAGIVLVAAAFTVQDVGLGDSWLVLVVLGTVQALVPLTAVPLRSPGASRAGARVPHPAG